MKYLWLTTLLLIGCNFGRKPININSLPEKKTAHASGNEAQIIIGVSGKFFGNLLPYKEIFLNTNKIEFDVGGAPLMASYLKKIKEVFPENSILLDTGYIFNNETNSFDSQKILQFYHYLNYDGINLTDREIKILQSQKIPETFPFLSSNIRVLKKEPTFPGKEIPESKMISINGLNILILSATTYKSINSKLDSHLLNHHFEDPVLSLLKHKKENVDLTIYMINAADESELIELANRFPKGEVNIIISSGMNEMNKVVNGTLVVQTKSNGQYFGFIEAYLNTKSKKLNLKKTRSYPAIKICRQFFKGTMDCTINSKVKNYSERINAIKKKNFATVNARFLGRPIEEDPEISTAISLR